MPLLSLSLNLSEDFRHHIALEAAGELLHHPLVEALVKCGILHATVPIEPNVDTKALLEQRCRRLARDPIQFAVNAVLQRAASDGGFRCAATFREFGLLPKFSRGCVHHD